MNYDKGFVPHFYVLSNRKFKFLFNFWKYLNDSIVTLYFTYPLGWIIDFNHLKSTVC